MEKRTSDYTISIPDTLYQKAMEVAKQKSLSVDEVIRVEGVFVESMLDIPLDEQAELKVMTYLFDHALFSMMREQMQQTKQAWMSVLMNKNNFGTITNKEYAELAAHVEEGDKLTLRKATAMKYLMDRGYKVSFDDLKSVDEQAYRVNRLSSDNGFLHLIRCNSRLSSGICHQFGHTSPSWNYSNEQQME